MKPLVSVIVPVYKVEDYLHRCVDSILQQTYTNLEIILVNDGSPDKCPEICDAYAALDSRVIVVHKKNGGVSSARNAGLEQMHGVYACFVDSDDFLPKNAILELYEAAQKENTPFVVGICGIYGTKAVKNPIVKQRKFTIQEEPEQLLAYIVENGSYSPYAKLYRTDLIQNNGLRFREDMKIAEDTVFLRTYLRYCDSVCMIPKVVYSYTADNAQSLSKKAYEEYCELYGQKMLSVQALMETLPLSEQRKTEFLAERAINGVALSVNHYFQHWDQAQALQYFEKTARCLLPWIDATQDAGMEKKNPWWQHYGKDFRAGNYDKIYHGIFRAKRRGKLRSTAGKLIRRIIKRTGE